MQFFYAAQILLIASLGFTKAAVTHFIAVLSVEKSVILMCRGLLAVIATWAVSGIVALAFQCDVPSPWLSRPGQCLNQQALYIFLGVVNIITDLAVITLSIALMWNVQTALRTRWQVIVLFAIRIM